MPIYEYKCRKCGLFEITQKITDKSLERCPTCRGKITKLISNTSFQLKGSGWYITDYARKEKTPKEVKAPAAEAKGDGKAAVSPDGGEKPSVEKKPAKTATPESSAS